MPEITWKNINNSIDTSGYNQAIYNLQRNLSALGNVGTDYINQRHYDDVRAFDKLSEMNTNNIINQMQQINTPEELQIAKTSGAYDLARLTALSNGAINGKDFNNAYGNWEANVLAQAKNRNAAQDYSPEAQAQLNEYYRALAIGDTNKAAQIMGNLQVSNDTMQNASKALYNTVSNERNFNRQSLQDDLRTNEQLLALSGSIENDNNNLIKLRENYRNAYQTALLSNPDLTYEDFMQSVPEYVGLINNIAQKQAQRDLIIQTRNAYLQGTSSNVTSGSPYNAQYSRTDTMRAFINAAQNQNINPSIVATVMGSESSSNSKAKNPNSTATGAGQILKGTWNGLASKLNVPTITKDIEGTDKDPRYNPEIAAKVSTHIISETLKNTSNSANKAGVQDDALIAKVGYFMGDNSANRFWNTLSRNPNIKADNFFSKKVLDSNEFLKGKSLSEVANYFKNTVDKAKKDFGGTINDFVNKPDNTVNVNRLSQAQQNVQANLNAKEQNSLNAKNQRQFMAQSSNTDQLSNNILSEVIDETKLDNQLSKEAQQFTRDNSILNSNNPYSRSVKKELGKNLSEYADKISAFKTEQQNKLLQQFISPEMVGRIDKNTFNVPEEFVINTTQGKEKITATELYNRFFNPDGSYKSDAESEKHIKSLFAQQGAYDRYTTKDNILHAIRSTKNPALILNEWQKATLDLYRKEEKVPDAKSVPNNYIPDMEYFSLGNDAVIGKNFLDKISALSAFNPSNFETVKRGFENIDKEISNLSSGANKMGYALHALQNTTVDANDAINMPDASSYLVNSGLINRKELPQNEKELKALYVKKGREIIANLPDNAAQFMKRVDPYSTLDSEEAKLMSNASNLPKEVSITPAQLQEIKQFIEVAGNTEEARKLIEFLNTYEGKLKIKNK